MCNETTPALKTYEDVEKRIATCKCRDELIELSDDVDQAFLNDQINIKACEWAKYTSALLVRMNEIERGDYVSNKHSILFYTYAVLSTRWPSAMQLLNQINERAEKDDRYEPGFYDWVVNGSTLALRELVIPFGSYAGSSSNDLEFRNAVNAIDTARHSAANFILDPNNESGELWPDYEDVRFSKVYNVSRISLTKDPSVIHWCMSMAL